MLELLSLKIKGAGRFVEEQDISISNRPNLIGVAAENRNTGGSSGGAKSTIFKALDWLYGVNEVPTTVLKSRYSKEMEVTGQFLWNGKSTTISRSTKSGLHIEWTDDSGEVHSVSGSSSIAEEKLDEILGMPRNLFRLISHKRQDERGFFLNLTPKESFEFMMRALGLDEWQKKLDTLAERVSKEKEALDKQRIIHQVKLEHMSSALTRFEEKQAALVKLQQMATEDNQDAIKALEKQKHDLESSLSYLISSYREKTADLHRPDRSAFVFTPDPGVLLELSAIEDAIKLKKQSVERENSERQGGLLKMKDAEAKVLSRLRDIVSAEKDVSALLLDKASIEAKKTKLEAGQCHTCGQHWMDENTKKEMSTLLQKIADISAKIEEKTVAIAEKDKLMAGLQKIKENIVLLSIPILADTSELELNMRRLQKVIESAKEEVETSYLAAMHEFSMRSEALSIDHKAKEDLVKKEIQSVHNSIFEAKLKISSLDANRRAAEKEHDTAKSDFEKSQTAVQDSNNELAKFQKNHDLAEEGRRAIKSYLMTVFEDALQAIGDRASKMLSNLPNMQTATIYFEPFKEVASGPNKGRVKEEVTALLSVDGEESVPIRSISGGERASLDLAVDLAVVDLIEERSGLGTNYLILDEPCTGMDSLGKEHYVEILKNSGTKKKVLIVDHSSEVKEMVDDTILVIREGLYSRVV